MNRLEIDITKLSDAKEFGLLLGKHARPGDVYCLDGDLGAGKTTLSQMIAKGLGVPVDCYVTSPSFAIMHEYAGRIPMYHMDFYRLQGSDEVLDLGFDEYFYLNGLTVIEWSTRALDILPANRLTITLKLHQDTKRSAALVADKNNADLLDKLQGPFQ